MREARLPRPVIPWWYWCMRYDPIQTMRDRWRAERARAALTTLAVVASL